MASNRPPSAPPRMRHPTTCTPNPNPAHAPNSMMALSYGIARAIRVYDVARMPPAVQRLRALVARHAQATTGTPCGTLDTLPRDGEFAIVQ